jgi:Rad3-related DNA helicase
MKDDEFDYHFPFDIPRRGQREVCKRIINAYNNGKKYVVLQAPTGSGKSVISYTVASYFASSDMKTFVLTSQKGLQDQYVNDFADTTYPVETVKGAANYRCDLDTKRSCMVGVCKVSKKKKVPCNCPYVRARNKVYKDATISILNYTYFLNMSVVTLKQRNNNMPEDKIFQKKRGLLVVDECHNLENELLSWAGLEISMKAFKEHDLKCPKLPNKNQSDKQIIEWVEGSLKSNLTQQYNKLMANIATMDPEDPGSRKESIRADFVDTLICTVNRLLNQYDQGVPISVNNTQLGSISVKPLKAESYADEFVFDFGEKVLMMSATVLNIKQFCSDNGLDRKDVEYIEMPCLFPKQNRPIYDVSGKVGKINYTTMPTVKPKIKSFVQRILKQHKGQRGIIHTQSYDLANYLLDELKDPRLFVPKGMDRDKEIQKFLADEEYFDGVLLSPSLTEGIDLSGDLGRFCVICKAPFASLGDPFVKKRHEIDPQWYQIETLRKLIQSCGRVTRSETDKSVTYILDPAVAYLLKNNVRYVPSWFYDAIKVVK